MAVETTGVVGAGLMGRDISGLLASAGYPVQLVDVDPEALDRARRFHETELERELREAGLDVEGPPSDRVSYDTEMGALEECDFVVEAVPEDLSLKRGVVSSLEEVLDTGAVVGTNTSSLTPSDVAADVDHPERVVLFHFANPALRRDMVEISGDGASEAALETAREVALAIRRHPIVLETEYRANGLSRLSASIKCSATWEMLEAEPAAIDSAARDLGFDRGPLELVDLIGLDVHLDTVDNLSEVYGERYRPPDEIRRRMEQMVEEGRLGKKSGEGFYRWEGDEALVPEPEQAHDLTPVLAALVNEAHRLVEDGVAGPETVDDILRRGGDSEVGPFDLEEMFGQDLLRGVLDGRHEDTGAGVYEPVF